MLKPQLVEFMRRMDRKSIAIIPAAREAVRSHDTNYRYRQNSDFFYLTGFEEPDAIAVITPAGEKKYTLFVRPRDPEREIWDGYRAGVEGAVRDFSADEAFPVSEFDERLPELLDGPAVLYYAFGHSSPEMDQKIIRQLTLMRETNRKPRQSCFATHILPSSWVWWPSSCATRDGRSSPCCLLEPCSWIGGRWSGVWGSRLCSSVQNGALGGSFDMFWRACEREEKKRCWATDPRTASCCARSTSCGATA